MYIKRTCTLRQYQTVLTVANLCYSLHPTVMPQEKVQEYWIEDSVKDKSFDDFYVLGKELGK